MWWHGRNRLSKPPPSATRPPLRTCIFNDLGSRPERIWTLPPHCYPRPVESRPIDRRVCVAVVGCQHVGADRRPAPARAFTRRYRAPPRFGDAAIRTASACQIISAAEARITNGPLNTADGMWGLPSASAAASSASSDTSQARTSSSAWSIAFSFMILIHHSRRPFAAFKYSTFAILVQDPRRAVRMPATAADRIGDISNSQLSPR